jgi:hypothetical protein
MDISELDQAVIAYFVAGPANDVNIAGRFFPYSDLQLILDDKFQIATRKFGIKVKSRSKAAAKVFVDEMIDKGGWSSKPNDFGGNMHQFQPDVFKATLKEMQASDPIVVESQGKGPEFWTEKFAALTAA